MVSPNLAWPFKGTALPGRWAVDVAKSVPTLSVGNPPEKRR